VINHISVLSMDYREYRLPAAANSQRASMVYLLSP
jgi:hypothetical protein